MSVESVFNYLSIKFHQFAILKVAVNPERPELLSWYKEHIEKHNTSICSHHFPNAGFDLLVPASSTVDSIQTTMISMDVKCELLDHNYQTCGYFMFPRSSISKTPLMLSNHTGIIDSGYRGYLIGAFRNLGGEPYTVVENTRLLQVCHPSMCPIYAVICREDELTTTVRGTGGFGSTGI